FQSAASRPINDEYLEGIPQLEEHDCRPISELEIREALAGTSNTSAPGEDHITWEALKIFTRTSGIQHLKDTFNSILDSGIWPTCLKSADTVIIPKPGKDLASVNRYRPIALFSTVAKLMEKVLLNRLQWEAVKYGILHPNQHGGTKKHSTDDAGEYKSESFPIEVGLRQGSALSPTLSALYITPGLKTLTDETKNEENSLQIYVDDGVWTATGDTLTANCTRLKRTYIRMRDVLGYLGLVVEHAKTELKHFYTHHVKGSPTLLTYNTTLTIDLGEAPYRHPDHVIVAADNEAAMKCLLDPGPHAAQSLVIPVIRALTMWLKTDNRRMITFTHCPAYKGIPLNEMVDKDAKAASLIKPNTPPPTRSVAWERAHIDRRALEIWKGLPVEKWGSFSHFLREHSNWKNQGGTHIKIHGSDTKVYVQFVRSIMGHAPIGQYRTKFFPEEPTHCPECFAYQDRYHVMFECEKRITTPALTPTSRKMRLIDQYTDRNIKFAKHIELSPLKAGRRKKPSIMASYFEWLKLNPIAFTFQGAPPQLPR
ncbi:hypothetical protein AX16_010319, partial [Volvariella volvacea WC 439]